MEKVKRKTKVNIETNEMKPQGSVWKKYIKIDKEGEVLVSVDRLSN